MASVTYIDRCPNCGEIFHYGWGEQRRFFGNPLQMCAKCKKNFFNSHGNEWENLTNEEKKSVLVSITIGKRIEEKYELFTLNELKQTIIFNFLFCFLLISIPDIIINIKRIKAWKKFTFDQKMLEIKPIQDSILRTKEIEYKEYLLNHGKNIYGDDFCL